MVHSYAKRFDGAGEYDFPRRQGSEGELPSVAMRRGLFAVDLEPAGSSERIGAPRPEMVVAASVHVVLEALRVVEFGHALTIRWLYRALYRATIKDVSHLDTAELLVNCYLAGLIWCAPWDLNPEPAD